MVAFSFTRFIILMVLSSTLLLGGTLSFAEGEQVDLNTATAAQLETIPGIGPNLAQRILDYRQKHGSFRSVEDVVNVNGIGEKTLAKFKSLVTVGNAQDSLSRAQSPAKP